MPANGCSNASIESRTSAIVIRKACSHQGLMLSCGPAIAHAKDLVYVWRGGCGLWVGSVSYLNIFATMGPPTRGFSSASSASALSFL
jgi:hypothetical protein